MKIRWYLFSYRSDKALIEAETAFKAHTDALREEYLEKSTRIRCVKCVACSSVWQPPNTLLAVYVVMFAGKVPLYPA